MHMYTYIVRNYCAVIFKTDTKYMYAIGETSRDFI